MERCLDPISADMAKSRLLRRPLRRAFPLGPKSLELEQRVSRLEVTIKTLTKELDVYWKHLTSLQAHLDHVAARVSRN